jgi:protein TonB
MEPKKNPKADLNQWSTIYLLSGLVFMLFVAWQAVEWKTDDRDNLGRDMLDVGDDLLEDVPVTQILTPPPPPPPPPPAPEVIEVVEDDEEVEETIIESTETDAEEVIEIEEIEEVEEEIDDVPFAVIENVPVFPGCEGAGNNDAKKACMSEKVQKFVQRKFDTDLANDLGLEGRQRISVQFKIDKNGNVVDVRARAPHPRLEQEAIDVVKALPKMTPGKQRGQPVGVLYALPILFQVEN